MPHLTGKVGRGGPILDVSIWLSERRRKALIADGKAVPPLVTVRGLIDTGASQSCVDVDVLSRLQIPPSGNTPVHTPSTGDEPHHFDVFEVAFVIPHEDSAKLIDSTPVVGAQLSQQGLGVLIGRDLLAQCMFFYQGPSKTFILSF